MSLRTPIPQPQKEHFPEITDDGLIWLSLVHQRLVDIRKENVTFNPVEVAANITVEQTVTLNGLKTDDIVIAVIKPTLTAGLGVLGGRVSAANTLSITFINATASGIDAGSEIYTVVYIKNSRS